MSKYGEAFDDYDASMIDAVVGAYACGGMHQGDAVRLLDLIGMEKISAIDLLDKEFDARRKSIRARGKTEG